MSFRRLHHVKREKKKFYYFPSAFYLGRRCSEVTVTRSEVSDCRRITTRMNATAPLTTTATDATQESFNNHRESLIILLSYYFYHLHYLYYTYNFVIINDIYFCSICVTIIVIIIYFYIIYIALIVNIIINFYIVYITLIINIIIYFYIIYITLVVIIIRATRASLAFESESERDAFKSLFLRIFVQVFETLWRFQCNFSKKSLFFQSF